MVGAGNSGAHAVQMAAGMGARVTVLDLDTRKLEPLDIDYRGRVVTLMSNPSNLESGVADADLLGRRGADTGGEGPDRGHNAMVRQMRPGSVIVDIAIDQGGCIESIRPTSHNDPVYKEHGVIHYAVPNMPALVGRTSTVGLTQATEAFVVQFVELGVKGALAANAGLAKGLNTEGGRITCPAVAEALGTPQERPNEDHARHRQAQGRNRPGSCRGAGPRGPESIDWKTVVFNILTIKGIYGREMYETWYKMTALIQGCLDISPVITHRLPFNEFKTGFDLMRSGRSGKIVLDWEAT